MELRMKVMQPRLGGLWNSSPGKPKIHWIRHMLGAKTKLKRMRCWKK